VSADSDNPSKEDEAYDNGYHRGHSDGYEEALGDEADLIARVRSDPVALINDIEFLDRQDWFDRLKAEAKRLGVNT
jgi:hypothetical protein